MVQVGFRSVADGYERDRLIRKDMVAAPPVRLGIMTSLLMIVRTLDEVGVSDRFHGQRVALIVHACAEKLKWSDKKKMRALCSGLIHDCGVSSTREHKNLMSNFVPEQSQEHCVLGASRLRKMSLLEPFSLIIAHHHTPYQELSNTCLNDEEKDIASLVFLADRLDYLRNEVLAGASFEQVILHKNKIANVLEKQSGTTFNPEFISVMLELIEIDAFWFNLSSHSTERMIATILGKNNTSAPVLLAFPEVYQLAWLVAEIVDAKSNFTYEHSIAVGCISKTLAKILKRPLINQQLIEIAGLLHDIGKLGTPDEILHKPGMLTGKEFAIMKLHVRETQQILFDSFNSHPLVNWAANHHERLDGSGYPNSLQAADLDMESRIVALVDVFQALSEPRPYRPTMPVEQRLEIIRLQVEQGKLDTDVFEALLIFLKIKQEQSVADSQI